MSHIRDTDHAEGVMARTSISKLSEFRFNSLRSHPRETLLSSLITAFNLNRLSQTKDWFLRQYNHLTRTQLIHTPHINSISIMNSFLCCFPSQRSHVRSRKSQEINKSFQSGDPGPGICLDNLLRAEIALFIIIIPPLIVSCSVSAPHSPPERERDMQSLGDANNMQPCIASSQPGAYFMRASIPSQLMVTRCLGS